MAHSLPTVGPCVEYVQKPFVEPPVPSDSMCPTCVGKECMPALLDYHRVICEMLSGSSKVGRYGSAHFRLLKTCCRACFNVFDHYYAKVTKEFLPVCIEKIDYPKIFLCEEVAGPEHKRLRKQETVLEGPFSSSLEASAPKKFSLKRLPQEESPQEESSPEALPSKRLRS